MASKILISRLLARLRRDQRAAAAAEFVLLLPILSAMLLGTLHYGVLLYAYDLMLNSARESARTLATGGGSTAEARTAALSRLPGWVDQGRWTVIAQDLSGAGTPEVNTTITVPIDAVRIVPEIWFVPSPTQLSVTVVMRKQV